MSDIIATVQSQEIASEFIELYDLEYAPGLFAYFYPGGLDQSLPSPHEIKFRDRAGAIKTYEALPMEAESFSITADGAYNRPTITVANIESVFSAAIGDLVYEDLIGQRITRRTTLKKYLVGGAGDTGDNNAPVEFPKQVYIIDTIKSKNILSVKFELSAPFDVAGIQLPTRVIIGNACPFKYRGADDALALVNMRGGCNWKAKFIGLGNNQSLFVSKNNEYIVPRIHTATQPVWGSVGVETTAVVGKEYRYQVPSPYLTKITSTGARSIGIVATAYWQAVTATTDNPADNNSNWRRIRVYRAYSSGTEYIGYTDKRYNEYVTDSVGKLWQVKRNSVQGVTPVAGASWTEGDICNKDLPACKKRFHAKSDTGNPHVLITTDSNVSLPFGGYPGALQRR